MIAIRLCSPSDGEIWPPSAQFGTADEVISVVYALSYASPSENADFDVAEHIEAFLKGNGIYAERARTLSSEIIAVVQEDEAFRWAEWAKRCVGDTYDASVREMYGSEHVEYYNAMARTLIALFQSTKTHRRSLCVQRAP